MGREHAYRLAARAMEQHGYSQLQAHECAKSLVDVLLNSGELIEGEAHRALMSLLRQSHTQMKQLRAEVDHLRAQVDRLHGQGHG